jgi:anti-anti-sigma regulatory factor
MLCRKCGAHVPPQNNFCTKCGTSVSQNFTGKNADDYFVILAKCKSMDYTNHGELAAMFDKLKDQRVLIDLGRVEFIDSVGVGGIVTLVYKTNHTKQDVKFIIKAAPVLKAIKALSVDNVLNIYEDEAAARTSWGFPNI